MKRFSEQLHKESEAVKLRAAEKRELRERLVSYMEYHPLPAGLKSTQVKKSPVKTPQILTDAFTTVSIPFSLIFKSSIVAAAIVLVVVPFAAEKAVPGDTLYAVKVQFNEDLRSALTFDSYQKVEWETERLNRRIAEAKLLASEGRLTDELEAEAAEAVKTHTENAKREIEELRITNADEAAIASIELDTTLSVQSTSLRADDSDLSDETGVPEANLIAEVLDESLALSEEPSSPIALPASEKMLARIEENTTRMYELLSSIEQVIPEDQLGDITRRIEDVERSISEVIGLSESDDESARPLMVDILQRTQKLIVYMTESKVIETVDIETLVPVVLTNDEEGVIFTSQSEEIENKLELIKELSAQVEDESILEKLDYASSTILDLTSKVASSSEDFDAFEIASEEALNMINDVITMLKQHLTPVEPEEVILEEVPSEPEESVSEEESDKVTESNEEVEVDSPEEEVIEEPEVTVEEPQVLSEESPEEVQVQESDTEEVPTEDEGVE